MPFLRWPGGKRWLASYIVGLIRGVPFKRYYEPFLGGGAVYFALKPAKAVLSDVNEDLINTYIQVRRRPDEVLSRLRTLKVSASVYHRVRRMKPASCVDRAVRFLYLNHTSFAGVHRVNRKGEFNVPFGGGGRTPALLWERSLVAKASGLLRSAELVAGDFEVILATAGKGDLVYCDPTYTVSHNNNGFVRYNERNFSWEDQKRLAGVCRSLAHRGAIVLVSNAVHPDIRELYPKAEALMVRRMSLLCPTASKRRCTEEHLFVMRVTA